MSIWYDLLLLIILLGGISLGFAMGMVRQLINVGSLVFAVLFASYYHPTITRWVRDQLGESDTLNREVLLFLLVVLLVWVFINLGAYVALRRRPRFLPDSLDRLIGMVLGLVSAVFAVVILTLLLNYATSVPWPDNDSVRALLAEGVARSSLKRMLLGLIPVVANLLEPFLPRGLPAFFSAARLP